MRSWPFLGPIALALIGVPTSSLETYGAKVTELKADIGAAPAFVDIEALVPLIRPFILMSLTFPSPQGFKIQAVQTHYNHSR